MLILLPVVAALTALLIVPGLLFHFDVTPKVAILLLGTAICLFDLTSVQHSIAALLERRRGRWLLVILAAQWCSLALSTALSTQPALSLAGSGWRRFGLFTQTGLLLFTALLAGWIILDRGNLRWFLRATAVAGLLTAVYGCLQYFGWDPLLQSRGYLAGDSDWTIVRPPSALGHAGYFATFQLFAIFAAVALLRNEPNRRWRWAAAAACPLGVLAIVLSGTRSAMLGLAVGILALLLWWKPRLNIRRALVAALIIAALAGFYFSPAGLKLRWRTQWYIVDISGGARLPLWRDSLRMASERLPAGFGPETFSNQFPRRQSLELARAYPDFYQESPHNVFLDVLVSQGLPGLLALGAFCVLALVSLPAAPPAVQAVGAGFLAGLVSQQFLCFTVPTAIFFYAMGSIPVVHCSSQAPARKLRWLLPAALLVALSLAAYAARLTIADALMAQVKTALAGGTPAVAAAKYARAERWQLPGGNPALYYAREMLNLSNRQSDPARRFQAWQFAMGAAVRAAVALEDRPNALVNLAAFQSTLNDARLVEIALQSAAAEAPNWYRPHWLLARLYLLTGRLPQAEGEARAAVRCNGGRDAAVQQTLNQVLAAK